MTTTATLLAVGGKRPGSTIDAQRCGISTLPHALGVLCIGVLEDLQAQLETDYIQFTIVHNQFRALYIP